jgi:hypothetical protein
MVVHTCNLSIQEVRLEDYKFKTSLNYMVKPCLKKKKEKEKLLW